MYTERRHSEEGECQLVASFGDVADVTELEAEEEGGSSRPETPPPSKLRNTVQGLCVYNMHYLILSLSLTSHSNYAEGKKRASKLSAIEMLERNYKRKAELKEQELELKRMELEITQRRLAMEEEERKQRLQMEMEEKKSAQRRLAVEEEERKQRFQMEMEEKKAFLELLKKHT